MEKMIPLVTNFKKIPSNSIICKLTWINDNYFNFMVRYRSIEEQTIPLVTNFLKILLKAFKFNYLQKTTIN